MTAATMIKRISAQRKEITRYEKEIKRYQKDLNDPESGENWKNTCRKYIEYYNGHIKRVEAKIAEMSKEAAKLADADERKAMVKEMAKDMAERGFKTDGHTTNGLRYIIYGNNGMTERSRYCWSMTIEGMGMVFTSGTLETVAEYILNN